MHLTFYPKIHDKKFVSLSAIGVFSKKLYALNFGGLLPPHDSQAETHDSKREKIKTAQRGL